MRSVQRTPEPEFLADIRAELDIWGDLKNDDGWRIRCALANDFSKICAYCERLCESSDSTGTRPNAETIDHFRPRQHFPKLSLDWLNLVYSCQRCNKTKGGSWPGYNGAPLIDKWLSAKYPRYAPVTEYVSPNVTVGQRRAEEFFTFDFLTGEIAPAEQLDPVEWSMAFKTIRDIDLNDWRLGENDPGNLLKQRRDQLNWLFEELNKLPDTEMQLWLMREFSQADKPFSSFISAWLVGK